MLIRTVRAVAKHGPSRSAGWAWYHLNEVYFEHRLGIATRKLHSKHASTSKSDEHVAYEPLPYMLIRKALAAIVDDVIEGEAFLDYGSGLGRVIIMAARHPFRRVIGLEISAELNKIANANVHAAWRRLKCPVELINTDATQFVVPPDVSVAHLFNPFTGETMAKVQAQIFASLSRAPRRFRVIYAHANDQANLFEKCSWLTLQQRLPTGVMHGMNLLVYEHRPQR